MNLKDKLISRTYSPVTPFEYDPAKAAFDRELFINELMGYLGIEGGLKEAGVQGTVKILDFGYQMLIEAYRNAQVTSSMGTLPIDLLHEARDTIHMLTNCILNPGSQDPSLVFGAVSELSAKIDELLVEFKNKVDTVIADVNSSRNDLPSRLDILKWVQGFNAMRPVGNCAMRNGRRTIKLNYDYGITMSNMKVTFLKKELDGAMTTIDAPTPPWMLMLISTFEDAPTNASWMISASELSGHLHAVMSTLMANGGR